MRVSRFDWNGSDARGLAEQIRALQPALGEVSDQVATIVEAVASGGDQAVIDLEGRFGEGAPAELRVPAGQVEAAPGLVEEAVAAAMRAAMENVAAAAREEMDATSPARVSAEGASVSFRSVPIAAAGAYAPGGGAAYPSTAIMCCVPAAVAGVERIAVASPPGPDGAVNPLVLAACSLAGATEVYAMGGAQAIAALALGTESVQATDIVVGPGNRYVQEAKRQLVGRVGIDAIAGPSELMVIADRGADPERVALNLCAQAEHGEDGLLVACLPEAAMLDELERRVEALAAERDSVREAPLALVAAPDPATAVELADALAPEHLELACADAARLAARVRYAGCVFAGYGSATAFGDYAAGSNHVLPTGGAGRFTGPLGPGTFIRRAATVEILADDAQGLASTVATLARAEGFPVHGESAEASVETVKESDSR